MRVRVNSLVFFLALAPVFGGAPEQPEPPVEILNPRIDMAGFLASALAAADHRENRRLSEAQFIAMSREPGTIVLDARSREKFDELHVKGAIHLSFPDIAIESLAELLPDKNTRILIYCNNNFQGNQSAFMMKTATTSLNLSTYVTLYDYGYRNVYELGPLLDLNETAIEFESKSWSGAQRD